MTCPQNRSRTFPDAKPIAPPNKTNPLGNATLAKSAQRAGAALDKLSDNDRALRRRFGILDGAAGGGYEGLDRAAKLDQSSPRDAGPRYPGGSHFKL